MTLKRFVLYSLIIHLLAMPLLLKTPVGEKIKEKLFSARLVTPKEAEVKAGKPLPPVIVPKYSPRFKTGRMEPSVTKEPPKTLFSDQSIPPTSAGKDLQGKPSVQGQPGGEPSEKGGDSGVEPPDTGEGVIQAGKPKLGMKNLFDSDVIAKSVIKQEQAQETEQKGKSSVTFDAKEFKYYGYMQRLKEKIEGIWQYPAEAAQKGLYGDLYISFTIKKNGTLGSVDLVRTSGYRSLDDAAMRALKDAAPFWPLPEDWKQDSLTIKGHFIYGLYGTHIR